MNLSCKNCEFLLRDYLGKIFFPSPQELLITGEVKMKEDILDVFKHRMATVTFYLAKKKKNWSLQADTHNFILFFSCERNPSKFLT